MGALARVSDRPQHARLETLVRIIRGEFAEMPGMRLTRHQFRRLWNLGPLEDAPLIAVLVAQGFLTEDADGRIGRREDVL
jgi:hypothetical protein